MDYATRRRHKECGLSSAVGLVVMAVGLVVVAVLILISMHGVTGGSGQPPARTSILSPAPVESQIKLCAEGRNSSYGDPPTPAQQARCLNELAGQIASGG